MKPMKHILLLCALCAFSTGAMAQQKDLQSSAKLGMLKKQRAALEEKIKVEDKKRNRQVAGVTQESMEQINLTQDSICLELRSRLATVNLEIEELNPKKTAQDLLHTNSTLLNSLLPDSTAAPAPQKKTNTNPK
ncbi:MAG: hypothetical protein HUK03_05325 [Bacteroidaceae bacterium]|nr:hypothetical protein [Bacteroidaceae bacterium]